MKKEGIGRADEEPTSIYGVIGYNVPAAVHNPDGSASPPSG
jgi:hypothetical protein